MSKRRTIVIINMRQISMRVLLTVRLLSSLFHCVALGNIHPHDYVLFTIAPFKENSSYLKEVIPP